MNYSGLLNQIQNWARELGFQQLGVANVDLASCEERFRDWIAQRMQGSMTYMERNAKKRLHPELLVPGTVRIISARMDYYSPEAPTILAERTKAYVSRYALGRDYHKTIRSRLARLAHRIEAEAGGQFRAFVDSAPVLEKAIAVKAGLGWQGKNTLVLNEEAGSWFFVGEIFTNLPLPVAEKQATDRCGACKACINVCPTGAILEPRVLDARKCISYLTIENKGPIPERYREAVGNRIFGCDDCQLICPWNRYAMPSTEKDFAPRQGLDAPAISDLLQWDEEEFHSRTIGMALRRINFSQWSRNLAVAAGNSLPARGLLKALAMRRRERAEKGDEMCVEHIDWAVSALRHTEKSDRDTDATR